MVLGIEGVDAGFGGLGLVEVLVYRGCLGFAEADEVDDVGEYLDEAVVGGFQEVSEGEVSNATLEDNELAYLSPLCAHYHYWRVALTSTSSFFSAT